MSVTSSRKLMALRCDAFCVVFFLVFEVTLQLQVADVNKQRLWWGKYSFDSQPQASTVGVSAAASSPMSELNYQYAMNEEPKTPNAYTARIDAEISAYKRGNSRTEQDSKYQKFTESSNLWEDSDFRPFRGLDNAEDPWTDKTNRMADECACDDKLKELEKKISELQDDTNRISAKVWDTVDAVQGLVKDSSKVGKQKHIISFAAQAASNIPYLKDTEIIVFDDVLVNNGAAYNPRSGIFTVPVSGVYIFTATIVSGFNSTIESMITLNGQEVARVYSGAYKNRGSGTNTVILNLREGDDVWVALFYGNGNYVHGKWSSFSGSLIETY